MILKKVLFPIFISILFFSCDSNFSSKGKYDEYTNLGLEYFNAKAYDSAYVYFEKAKSYSSPSDEDLTLIYPLLMLSDIQRIKNDYHGSEESLTEALTYIQKSTDSSYVTFIYNNLGLSFQEQFNFTEALYHYQKSLAVTSDELSKCIIKNNIAYTYIKQENYLEAKAVLDSIKDNIALRNEPLEHARVLDNFGFTLLQLNENTSIDYLVRSKNIREKEADIVGLTASYMHLAAYYQSDNIAIAKDYALKAYEMAKKTNNPDDRIEALQFLTKTSDGTEAKEYAIKTFRLNDSIQTARQKAKNQFAKIKYDSKQALKELEKQKRLKEFSVIGIILLFGIGIFIYYRIKKRNRKRIKETAYQTETRIAKKLHDELANDVHNTIAFAETQDLFNPKNKDILLENLEAIYDRTRNISSENKDIDTGEHYLDKLKAMLATYNSPDRNVIVNMNAFNHLKTSKEVKVIVHRVVQELMVNMKKHSQCSLASVLIKSTKKGLQINYSDNGIGTDNLLHLKNGLQNVENRILSINGTINFDTAPEKGFKVKIEIPK